MEPIAFLRTRPPFDKLDAAGVRAIDDSLEVVYLPRGSSVLRRDGTPSTHLWILRKGSARLERDGRTVQLLEEGDCFGFPSLIAHAAPASDVVTAEDTLCYRIPGPVFDRLLGQRSFADFFLSDLAARLRGATADPLPRSEMMTPLDKLMARPPLFVAADATVAEAARRMTEAGTSSILVAGDPPGILTDHDLRGRVLAAGLGGQTPVSRVMTSPVRTLPSSSTLFEAMVFMLEHRIQHVPLEAGGEIVSMVASGDLLRLHAHDPLHLIHKLEPASYGRALHGMIESLAAGGLEALQIARVVSRLGDSLIALLLKRAEAELGPPPCAYAFLVLGSEGRMEQLLATDQDNALVYERPEDADYFAKLAERVVAGLVEASYPPCPGGYMATRWCRPLAELEQAFASFIARPEPQALLDAAVFFDFRRVAGDCNLAPLEQAVARAGEGSVFLARLAAEALRWHPPLGLFHQLKPGERGLDLKQGGIQPIVSLARVLGLEAGGGARGTVARLDAAVAAGTLSRDAAATLTESFRFLLGLRLRTQLREGVPVQTVNPKTLSPLERGHLKDVFVAIAHAQDSMAQRYQTHRLS